MARPSSKKLRELDAALGNAKANSRLSALLRTDHEDGALGAVSVRIDLRSEESSSYALGETLVDLDRELRRAQAYIVGRKTDVPRRKGELELLSAERGNSIDCVLAGFGGLAGLMLSDPIQLALTLHWFWERRPKRWGIRTPSSPLPASQILSDVTASATQAIRSGQTVSFSVDARRDGSVKVKFKSS